MTQEARIGVSESPDDWDAVVGSDKSYHQRTMIDCPFHFDSVGACVIDGWSHNEEPQTSSGTWRCLGCGKHGTWMQEEQHDTTPYTGLCNAKRMRMELA